MNPSSGLMAVLLIAPWSADRPAEPALLAVDQPVIEISADESAPATAARPCRRCRNTACRPGHEAFVIGATRYEPRLRDIRLAPAPRMLPGNDFGRAETLPVLPPRRAGYFRLPAW